MTNEETTAFANALIFDGMSAELREGCVRVAAGMIVEVGEGPEPGDRVVDCRGRTVIPGLIDAHFHAYGASLSLLEIETSPLSYLALAGARRLAGALVPTLVTYDAMERRGAELGLAAVAQAKNREVLDAGRTAIRLAREAGVRIGWRSAARSVRAVGRPGTPGRVSSWHQGGGPGGQAGALAACPGQSISAVRSERSHRDVTCNERHNAPPAEGAR